MADLFPEAAAAEDATGDERYTTRETIEWCKQRAGVEAFDLDVAACEESHWAECYYTKSDNGLARPWFGRVWCNPPYSDIAPWVERAIASFHDGAQLVAMLIPATRTEQAWWQRNIEPFRDWGGEGPAHVPTLRTYFLPGRTSFARPGSGGVGQSGSPFGCVLLVWRRA